VPRSGIGLNELLGANRLLLKKHGKVSGWRKYVEMVKDVCGMTAVICGVVDNVEQDVSASHGPAATTNELEVYDFTQL